MVHAALVYAGRGWPVFPCRPQSKAPATRHGFRDATTDPDHIRWLWGRLPAANVGIACGVLGNHVGPNVVDVDTKGGAPGYASLNRLVRAGLVTGYSTLVRTPTSGLHLYFAGDDQRNGSIPAAGIDFRGTGGYVLAPPSVWDGRPDLDWPEPRPYRMERQTESDAHVNWQAIRELLQPAAPVLPRARPGRHSDPTTLASWVSRLQERNRNNGLFWAACRTVENGQDPEPLVAAAVQTGLTEAEARRTVASARQTIGGAA